MHHPTPGQHEEDSIDEDDDNSHLSSDQEDEHEHDSDYGQVMSALRVPPPDAEITELRNALTLCQRTLTLMHSKLGRTTKEQNALNAALPQKKSKAILNKKDSLNESISRIAKKFALLYRLWIIQGLFPAGSNPTVDLYSADHWISLATKRDAVLTELFVVTPKSLHKQVVAYKSFGSVFSVALNQERSNILRVVKEASALVFAPLKISDSTIFTSLACKRDDPEMKRLSMKDGIYHRLAPLLFTDPSQMTSSGFLRSPILVNILCLLIFGRAALTREKARGGARARGQIHSIYSVTEGLIAAAAIFARYLLTPDPELQAVGSETKIPYEDDYDFYLQCLLKRSNWAIETISFFNAGIFGSDQVSKPSSDLAAPSAPPRTWEDDFLDGLDNDVEADMEMVSSPQVTGIGTSISAQRQPQACPLVSHPPPLPHWSPTCYSPSHSPIHNSPLSSPSLSDPPQVTSLVSIHNHSASASSLVSRLQVEVGQMSISGKTGGSTAVATAAPLPLALTSHLVSSACCVIMPVPAQPSETYPPAGSELLVKKKHVTRSRTKAKK